MAKPQPVDPITDPNAWDSVSVAGVRCPGIAKISGFDRSTNWDVKVSKGTRGGTMTLSEIPPATGKVRFMLWTAAHFQIWREQFRKLLTYSASKKTQAISIYHPSLPAVEVSAVVVSSISLETMESPGLYYIEVDFKEYLPPPKKSITSTIKDSKEDKSKAKKSALSGDPIADAQQREIDRLLTQIDPKRKPLT